MKKKTKYLSPADIARIQKQRAIDLKNYHKEVAAIKIAIKGSKELFKSNELNLKAKAKETELKLKNKLSDIYKSIAVLNRSKIEAESVIKHLGFKSSELNKILSRQYNDISDAKRTLEKITKEQSEKKHSFNLNLKDLKVLELEIYNKQENHKKNLEVFKAKQDRLSRDIIEFDRSRKNKQDDMAKALNKIGIDTYNLEIAYSDLEKKEEEIAIRERNVSDVEEIKANLIAAVSENKRKATANTELGRALADKSEDLRLLTIANNNKKAELKRKEQTLRQASVNIGDK